ncbi:hypothetical protein JZX76_05210 [Haloarcula hispanica]|uniref:Lipoprotein n=1 Tax=Haloarcula hispanica TaxID=51589 RepID=A0A482SZW6_HALHI|nr:MULTISPECIES: hypothetical protein [Haloarcula]KAA9407056.1 hypothetical protein Har1131_09665 [Haloarcula sp. CBA1131]KZX48691.1 hypothetical protein AV929_06940 [Haloarcula sp. K1]MCJ0618938.1 hypothetical protein [Haloarcula hispanica]RYJ09478.1 hypothetical protein ELS20_05190 [Haloarcula hispanica]
MPRTTRRRTLYALGASLSVFAGCTQFESESGAETGQSDGGASEPTVTATAAETDAATPTGQESTAGQTETATELDLREANVVGVELTDEGDDYRFDVTLYHDDDGEDGYANWWQVETLAGDRLGRRDLRHAHSTAPFTRSETITVPDDTTCVVVRGHDQTHGYGGQAMTVTVPDGETRAVEQGAERQSVTESDCP